VWVGALLLVLAVALVPVWLGWDRGEPVGPETALDPAGTPTPGAADDASATEDGASPDPTGPAEISDPDDPGAREDEDAEDARPPAPPPPTLRDAPHPSTVAALTGTAVLDDPEGDVADSAGEPAGEGTGPVDLRRVELDGDGASLAVTWTVAEPVPSATSGSLLWSVDLWAGEDLAASITVQQIGARRVAGVLDWSTGEQIVLPEAIAIDGTRVHLDVPLEALPAIDGPVTWTALGQADGGLEDVAPQEGRADFPG
jgi:hypothetical protein